MKKIRIYPYKIILYFIIFDMILGGSGNLIKIGPLSGRMILLGIVLVYEFIISYKKKIVIDWATLTFLIYLIINYMLSLINNNTGFEFTVFRGYATLITAPFFIYAFSHDKKLYIKIKEIICFFSVILALLSIILWLYCLINGVGAYKIIEIHFLRKYNLGYLSYIGNIPRIYFKCSVFESISLLFIFADILSNKKNKKNIIIFLILTTALIMTFTVGLLVFTMISIGMVFWVINKEKGIVKILFIGFVGIFICGIIYYRFGISEIFNQRFSGDYTFSYKFIQFRELVKEWIKRPILGMGVGHTLTIDYGYKIKVNEYNFEVMWMQLLMDTGIVGMGLYLSILYKMLMRFKLFWIYNKNCILLVYGVGVIFLCLLSFTNPYMNNTIGLTYTSLCLGIAYSNNSY